MNTENLGELFSALAVARATFGTVTKDKKVKIDSQKGGYAYAYADLAGIIEATASALAANGLVIIQEPEVQDDSGRLLVTVHGAIAHKSGGVYALHPLSMPVVGTTAQAVGSAISYARRYQLQAALNLAADDDDASTADGRKTAPERTEQTKTSISPTGKPFVPPEASTGSPLGATGQLKKPNAARSTLDLLDELGVQFYSLEAWEDKCEELVYGVTHGSTRSKKELTQREADHLIDGLKRRINQRETEQQPA